MTGGFLWGFLFMAVLCGIGVQLNRRLCAIVLGLSGLALCHICGTFQFMLVTGSPVLQSFLTASAPYLIKDVISVVLAFLAAGDFVQFRKRQRWFPQMKEDSWSPSVLHDAYSQAMGMTRHLLML